MAQSNKQSDRDSLAIKDLRISRTTKQKQPSVSKSQDVKYSKSSCEKSKTKGKSIHRNEISTRSNQMVENKATTVMKSALALKEIQKGYTCRPIVPATKAELIPVAQAMHGDDFAPRVKKLFDPEREAAIEAIKTGIYIGWRCESAKHDCIRVGRNSTCFCGHLLSQHAKYTGQSVRVPCGMSGCLCKAFAFVPSRAEDVGEFWLQRRPNYDPSTWHAKCKCKHTHGEHVPKGARWCRARGCGCTQFLSNFLCCACDRHWEQHETVFETTEIRKREGIPYGDAYLPFHEFPELRNVVLSGREDDDSQYRALTSGQYAIPEHVPSKLALQLRGADPK